jgi:hypothetical protein
MKVGDLVSLKNDWGFHDAKVADSPPVRVIVEIATNKLNRRDITPAYFIFLDDDPSSAEDPLDYYVVSSA